MKKMRYEDYQTNSNNKLNHLQGFIGMPHWDVNTPLQASKQDCMAVTKRRAKMPLLQRWLTCLRGFRFKRKYNRFSTVKECAD